MPTAEVKSVWWACITWPHKSAKLSQSSLLLGGKCYWSNNPWPIWTVYALSLSLSACFLRTRFVMSFAKDKGLSLNAAALSLCPSDMNGKLLSPNHLWSLPAAPHSDLSARQYKGVIPGYDIRPSALQHVIRGCFRSFSATASLRHRTLKYLLCFEWKILMKILEFPSW